MSGVPYHIVALASLKHGQCRLAGPLLVLEPGGGSGKLAYLKSVEFRWDESDWLITYVITFLPTKACACVITTW